MTKANKATCVICGEEKNSRDMLTHRNENMADNVGFCKICVQEQVDHTDLETVTNMLRLLNIPFVDSIWDVAVSSEVKYIFSKYLQLMVFQKGKYATFMDGEFPTKEEAVDVNDEMIAKWGQQESENDYRVLEIIYDSFTEIKKPNGRFERDRYVQCAKLKKMLDDALNGGDVKEIKDLRKSYEDELNALNLNIKDSEEDTKTYGEMIKAYEEHSPVPEPDDDLKDIDGISKYVKKNFLNPVKRMLGYASEEEEQEIYE